MAKDFSALISDIIEKVGGAENIVSVTHCATRLRFTLKDNNNADLEAIKKLKVFGAQFSGEQLQIIIGNDVNIVYDELVKKLGITASAAIDENLDGEIGEKKKLTVKGVFVSIIDSVVQCIVPIIPILGGTGLIKAFLMIFEQFGWISADSATAVTLTWVADAGFYFMPIFAGYFAAKKFKANPVLGMGIGAILLHPTFVSMAEAGNAGSVFGIPIYATTYSSTIVPVILSCWILGYVERFVRKIVPSAFRIMLEPFLTILIMVPLTLCLLAPLGAMLSSGFATIILGFHDAVGPIAVAVLCAIIPFVVMTGLHLGLIPVMIQTIASAGRDNFIHPALMISNFAQGAACLAVGIKTKNAERRVLAMTCSFSDIIPHISEPGMYGVTLKYKTPMLGAVIGCFIGGLYLGFTGAAAFTFSPPSIFSLVLYASSNPMTLINMIIGCVIAMIVTFVVTMFLYKDSDADKADGLVL